MRRLLAVFHYRDSDVGAVQWLREFLGALSWPRKPRPYVKWTRSQGIASAGRGWSPNTSGTTTISPSDICRPRSTKPKLQPIRQPISCLTWAYAGLAGWHSGYVKVSGIAVPRRVKASPWVLVGSVSMGMVTWVPVYRTWLRVRVAR